MLDGGGNGPRGNVWRGNCIDGEVAGYRGRSWGHGQNVGVGEFFGSSRPLRNERRYDVVINLKSRDLNRLLSSVRVRAAGG